MFYIFLLQTSDSVYETTTNQSIDFDVNELFNDVGIGSSIDPMRMLEKNLKKIHVDMLRLLFIILHIDEIKANVQVMMQRSQALKVSCRIII